MPIANVELNTTFDEWRIRTNQLIVQGDQLLFSISDLYPRTNTMMLNANTSYNIANVSAVQANTARLHANAAHLTANAGFDQANVSRSQANVSFVQANTARTHANAAHLTANAAFDKANTVADGLAAISTSVSPAFIQANTARTHANLSFEQANTARTHANLAFNQANTARTHANLAFERANIGGVTIVEDSISAVRYVTFSETTSGLVSRLNVSSTQLTFNPSTGTLTATNFDSASDINKKTDIAIIQDAINKTNQLNGVQFTWKHTGQPSAGIIAQDLQKVMPELVSEDMSVSYNGIIGLLVEAIKELNRKIEKLENK